MCGGFQALPEAVVPACESVCGGKRTQAQALTYVLDDPVDRGLKELIHGLARHPEHPL